jgi:hypothetical protein
LKAEGARIETSDDRQESEGIQETPIQDPQRLPNQAHRWDKVTLADGTVVHSKMIFAATGWSTDSSFRPGGSKAGEYDSLAAADIPKPFYLRFYDQEHPGIFLYLHVQRLHVIH